MSSVCFQDQPFNIIVIHVCVPTTDTEEAEVEWFCEDLQDLLELTPKKPKKTMSFFIRGDWNIKVESQEIPDITGKSGRGVPNEAGQRLTGFFFTRTCRSLQTQFSNNPRGDSNHGNHHMANTEIRLIIFFAAKDGEAL